MTHRIRCALLALVLFAALAATPLGTLTARADPSRDGVVAREQAQLVGFARGAARRAVRLRRRLAAERLRLLGLHPLRLRALRDRAPAQLRADFDLGRHVARRRFSPGDLVFFDGVGHVGMYVGDGRFIHAPHTGATVSIEPLAGWYDATYDGARRIL